MAIGNFLSKLGKAVIKKGGGLLDPLIAFDPSGASAAGKAMLEVAGNVLEQYEAEHQSKQLRIEMEELLAVNQAQLREEVRSVVEQVAGSLAVEMREQLASYLAQAQSAARQAARHLGDPSATTVLVTVSVDQPQDLAAFLPARPARFRAGDHVPNRPEWRLLELLGAGGFGEVWKARNDHVGDWAFKFFLDKQARERLAAREAIVIRQVQAAGRREGVVPLLDASPTAEPPWLAFEYIDGGDLCGLLASWQNLPVGDRLRKANQTLEKLARVVGYFHRLDPPVVHRDLKPNNILVRQGSQTELLVADFGIGQILPVELSSAAGPLPVVLSTVRAYTSMYASPQHKKFLKADRRDDVYALGVIWYQLMRGDLTLERPSGEGWKRTLAKLGVEDAVVALLNRCWDDEPEERPDDALVLADEMTAILSTETRTHEVERERQRREQERAEQEKRRREEQQRLAEEIRVEEQRLQAEREKRQRQTMGVAQPVPIPTQTPRGPGQGTSALEVRVVSHSQMFYWWPVWVVGFVLGVWTLVDGGQMVVVPAGSYAEAPGMLVLPQNKPLPAKTDSNITLIRNTSGRYASLIFCVTLLVVIVVTNAPLRGIWSLLVLFSLIVGAILLGCLGWWDSVVSTVGLLDVRMNAGGYFLISGCLFVIWVLALLVFDHNKYAVFTPGQMKVRESLADGEKVYDTAGLILERQRSDLFRHWLLGLGSGDLIIKTSGAYRQQFNMPNVLFVARKMQAIEELFQQSRRR